MQRVFHPIAVHFKGSGFYNTDYGTSKRKREMDASAKAGADKHDAKSKDKKGSCLRRPRRAHVRGSSDSSGQIVRLVRLVRRHLGTRSLLTKSAHLVPAADASPCGRRPLADNPTIGFATVDHLARSSTAPRRTAYSSTDS